MPRVEERERRNLAGQCQNPTYVLLLCCAHSSGNNDIQMILGSL